MNAFSEALALSTFIFLGVNALGGSPAMELVACESPEAAVAQARAWLLAHTTCVRVQVWRSEDDLLVADVERTAR